MRKEIGGYQRVPEWPVAETANTPRQARTRLLPLCPRFRFHPRRRPCEIRRAHVMFLPCSAAALTSFPFSGCCSSSLEQCRYLRRCRKAVFFYRDHEGIITEACKHFEPRDLFLNVSVKTVIPAESSASENKKGSWRFIERCFRDLQPTLVRIDDAGSGYTPSCLARAVPVSNHSRGRRVHGEHFLASCRAAHVLERARCLFRWQGLAFCLFSL